MTLLAAIPTSAEFNTYKQLELQYEHGARTLYSWMCPRPRPCFNHQLLVEIERCEKTLASRNGYVTEENRAHLVEYVVFGSKTPGVFNLGGDLNMFIQAILAQDRKALAGYAGLCIENIYRRSRGFDADITTIALVQGKALGGGFEAALAADVIIAERSATFGLPEVLFNMFPGMGALSFLTRRVGSKKAEEIITSGQVYSANELLEHGVIDQVVDDGAGIESTRAFIHQRERKAKTFRALRLAKRFCQPVTFEELRSIVDVWVDTAMKLEPRDLRMMARLVRAQERLLPPYSESPCAVEPPCSQPRLLSLVR